MEVHEQLEDGEEVKCFLPTREKKRVYSFFPQKNKLRLSAEEGEERYRSNSKQEERLGLQYISSDYQKVISKKLKDDYYFKEPEKN